MHSKAEKNLSATIGIPSDIGILNIQFVARSKCINYTAVLPKTISRRQNGISVQKRYTLATETSS